MHAQILRAEQPLLLGCNSRKVNRVRGPHRRLRKRTRQFEHDAASCAVIGGAVVNVVPSGVGVDAEMIVVGRIKHRLIGRAGAGHPPYDIRAHIPADAAFHMSAQMDGKFNRMERSRFARTVDRLVQIAQPASVNSLCATPC